MKPFVACTMIVTLATTALGQNGSRYGASSELPPELAKIESAFSTSPPAGRTPPLPARGGAASPTAGRYGASTAPSLPASTPITSRNDLGPVAPLPTQQAPPVPPVAFSRPSATPSRPTTAPSPIAQRPPITRPSQRFEPTSRQPSSGVTLPALTPEQSRSVLASSSVAQSSNSPSFSADSRDAQRIMSQMLQAPSGSQLRGTPVRVADVTRGALTRDEQSHRVEAYWDLCASVADYYLGLLEENNLARLQQRVPAMSQSLRAAQQSLHNRVETARKAATAGQRRLASMMGMTGDLPLPADGPFCGEYRTEFQQLFANRSTSDAVAEAQLLDELLPLRHAELIRASQAVGRSEEWVESVASRSRNSDGTGMLRALELLALNRRAFVQIAKDYNRRIARYTELSNPGRVDNNVLVAMLVGSSDRVAINSVATLR